MILTDEQIESLGADLENITGIDSVDFESTDENENDIIRIIGEGGYNVDWTDREGRHPWVQQEFEINLNELSYTCESNCSSKDGRHDETSNRDGEVNEVNDLAEAIECDFSDIAHEIDG
jgi:hypothetical protein